MTSEAKCGVFSMSLGGALVVLTLATGCVVPKLVGDGLETDGGGGTGSGGIETEGVSDTEVLGTSGDETEGVPSMCEGNPNYQCEGPYDCGAFPCGSLNDWFDADGCIRSSCSDDGDCDADEVCFRPIDYGGCASSGLDCVQDGPVCSCGADPDCGGRYCVAEDEIPGATCFEQTDEESCMNEGCTDYRPVVEISETCECTIDRLTCMFINGGVSGGPADYFWHEDTLTVAYFELDPQEALPYRWKRCTDADAPPACGCNAPMAEPTCM